MHFKCQVFDWLGADLVLVSTVSNIAVADQHFATLRIGALPVVALCHHNMIDLVACFGFG